MLLKYSENYAIQTINKEKPILCRYVDEKNIPMLETMQECMGADKFFDAINRPYDDDNETIAQKIMAL